MRARISLACVLVFFSSAAVYADGYVAPKAPVVLTATNWTGFYAGLNAGYAWGDDPNAFYNPPGFPFTLVGPAYSAIGSGSLNWNGFAGGGQAGYNLQLGTVVWGVEADFDALELSSSFTHVGTPPGNVQLTSTASASTDWVATFRGRVGLTEGNLLVYVTGGFAISQIKFNQANTYAGLGTESFASSSTETGWTAGAGAEYALNRNWAIRGEYLRIEFDDVGGTAPFFGLHTHSLGDLDTNLVRGGVNYRF
jgi:outer membrane immunogenic protein